MRTVHVKGEQVGTAVLTEDNVREITKLAAAKQTYVLIANTLWYPSTKIPSTKLLNTNSGLMSKKKSSPKFKIGDRVAEKPKPRTILTSVTKTLDRIKPYTYQRYGTVLDTVYQKTSKATVPYLKIVWDGSQSPSTHAQCRICLEKDLATETINFFNATD
jgi:hypothetical protein